MTNLSPDAPKDPFLPSVDVSGLRNKLNATGMGSKIKGLLKSRSIRKETQIMKEIEANLASIDNVLAGKTIKARGYSKENSPPQLSSLKADKVACKKLQQNLQEVRSLVDDLGKNRLTDQERLLQQALFQTIDQQLKISEVRIDETGLLISELEKQDLPSFEERAKADTLFNIVHLGSAELKLTDSHLSSTVTLPFVINSLEKMRSFPEISRDDRKAIRKLAASYRLAYKIAQVTNQMSQYVDNPEKLIKAKKVLQELIINELKEHGEITLSTGYRAQPQGHEIALKLTLSRQENKEYVEGEVVNRGEGVGYHGETIVSDLRERVIPFLSLGKAALTDLQKSHFLENLSELTILSTSKLGSDGQHQVTPTSYTIDDFYDVCLSEWPASIDRRAREQEARGGQRGEVCSLAAYVTQMRDVMSKDVADHAKLDMRMRSLELVLEHGTTDYPERADQLEWAIEKTNRSLKKLAQKGKATLEELDRAKALTEKVASKICEIRTNEARRLAEEGALLVTDPEYVKAYTVSISEPPAIDRVMEVKTQREKAVSFAFKSDPVQLVHQAEDVYNAFKEIHRSGQGREALRLLWDYLKRLPDPAINAEAWRYDVKVIDELVYLAIKTSIQEGKALSMTAEQAIIAFQVSTALLTVFDKCELVPRSLLKQQAGQMLFLIQNSWSQLRISDPESFKRLEKVLTALKDFTERPIGCFQQVTNEKFRNDRYMLSRNEYNNLRDVQEDPLTNAYYEITEKIGKKEDYSCGLDKTSDPVKRTFLLMREKHKIAGTAYGIERYNEKFYNKTRAALDAIALSERCLGNIVRMVGVSGKATWGDVEFAANVYVEKDVYHVDKTAGSIELFDKKNPSVGALIESLYPWEESERTVACELLDRRKLTALAKQEQNEQLLHREAVNFGQAKIGPVEYQELLSINIHDDMVIPQAIRYFTRNFHRLRDPRFQALLEGFLLTNHSDGKGPILAHVLMSSDDVKHRLLDFFEASITRAEAGHFIEVELSMLRLLAEMIAFSSSTKQKELQEKAENLFIRTACQLMQDKTLSRDEHAMVNHWIVSCTPYVSSGKQLVQVCLQARVELLRNADRYTFRRHGVEEDFHKGVGALGDVQVAENRLPWWVLEHDEYLFKDPNPLVEKVGSRYEFTDKDGIKCAVEIRGKTIIPLMQQTDSSGKTRWFRLDKTPSLEVGSPPPMQPGGVLSKDAERWTSVEKPFEAVLLSKDRKSIRCRLAPNKNGQFEIRHPQKNELLLAASYSSKNTFEARLLTLDSSKDVLAWRDANGRLKAFEYPRLGLTLTKEGDPPKWHSSLHQGYYIDAELLTEFEPCTHYIVLKNEKGDRIVVTSNQRLERAKPDVQGLGTVKSGPGDPPKLLTYQLQPNGKIKSPSDPYKLLYLAYIELSLGKYKNAQAVIQRLNLHPIDWDDSMREVASWLYNDPKTKDQHPHACSLRMQLLQHKESLQHLTHVVDDYFHYLDQLNNIFGYELPPKIERNIIEMMQKFSELPDSRKAILAARMAELLGGLEGQMPADRPERFIQEIPSNKKQIAPNFSWISKDQEKKMLEAHGHPQLVTLRTRPGAPFVANFIYYYGQIKDGGAEREAVLELLRLARNGTDQEVESLRRLLLGVSLDPGKFPSTEELVQAAERGALKDLLGDVNVRLPEKLNTWGFDAKASPLSADKVTAKKTTRLVRTAPEKGALIIQENRSKLLPSTALATLIDNECLREQSQSERWVRIDQKIDALKELKDVYNFQMSDPCVKRSCKRLVDGIDEMIDALEVEKRDAASTYTLVDEEKLMSISDLLTQSLEEGYEELTHLENEILSLAHSYPEDLALEVRAGILSPLSLNNLILFFGRNDNDAILRSNPSLADKLPSLKELVTRYLFEKTEQQVLERAQSQVLDINKLVDEKGWDSEAVKQARENFVKTLSTKRAYEASDEPTLLAFEYASNMRLNKEQVDALKELTGEGLVNVELEARTGFGKSKVLIPLWLFLTSGKDRLTVMSVPQSLLAAQTSHLREMLGSVFDQGVQTITFDRKNATNLAALKELNNQLDEAKTERRIVLLSINSLHGMAGLALKEAILQGRKEHAEELYKIRQKLAENCSAFIDESKECLDVGQRYDYSVGNRESILQERCQEVGKIYEKLILDQEILKSWNFEFIPQLYAPEKKDASDESFGNSLRDALVEKALQMLHVPEKYLDAARESLLGGAPKEAEAFFSSLSEKELSHFARVRRQLNVHLSHALMQKCGIRYDLDENRIAIPCRSGDPRPNSEFSTLDDLLDYTIQANLKTPLDASLLPAFVEDLKEALAKRGNAIEGDPSYQLFQDLQKKLHLPPLSALTAKDMEAIIAYLNSPQGIEDKLHFITARILPTITSYQYKITDSCYSVLSALAHVQAASGTVNADTLPPSMSTREKKSAPITNLLALWLNSQDKVTTIAAGSSNQMLKDVLKNNPSANVLTDTAGMFRDLGIEEVLKTLFEERPEINGVTYYDTAGNCMIWEKGAQAPINRDDSRVPVDETFIFIRQGKSIGSDTPMPLTAQGINTVGIETTESHFLQGLGRLRGLEKGQVATIAVADNERRAMLKALGLSENTPLTVEHILRYVKIREGLKRGEDYFTSLGTYLDDLIEAMFWQNADTKELFKRFKSFKELLVTATESDPLNDLRNSKVELSAEDAVALVKTGKLDRLRTLLQSDPALAKIIRIDLIEELFEKYVDYQKLSDKISSTSSMEPEESIAEAEEEKAAALAVELESEQMQEDSRALPALHFTPAKPKLWDADYVNLARQASQTAAKIAITPSPNLKKIQDGESLDHLIRKPAFQMVLGISERGEIELIPLDIHDAREVLKRMGETEAPGAPGRSYYLLSGSDVLASDAKTKPGHLEDILQGKELAKVSIISKIFTADKNLSLKEVAGLKAMDSQDREEILKLSEDYKKVWPHLHSLHEQILKALQ